MQFKIAWVPVWYSPESPIGRGVYDVDLQWPEKREEHGHPESNTRVARVGREILSTPAHDETYERTSDKRALDLRKDITHMAIDLQSHTILYRPPLERRDNDADERIEVINNMNFDEWKKKRDALQPKRR